MTTNKIPLRLKTGCLYISPIIFGSNRLGGRYASTGRKIIRENDVVLLKQKSTAAQKKSNQAAQILTKPLHANKEIATGRAPIPTNDILGMRVRDVVKASNGAEYRIHEPSLGEYTDLSPRLVTPIYAQDAQLIISLLDLHPSVPCADNRAGHDKLEIFEAGTGHGALTLNLARAIHGANKAAPPLPIKMDYDNAEAEFKAKEAQDAYDEWRSNRRAVIHTLDQSKAYSAQAQITVKNFRQGMYFPNVDFHVSSIEEFISERMSSSDAPFLDHTILDLPNTHRYLEIIGKALKSNGTLITWCPSITQVNKCVTLVKAQNMPFLLKKVVEVGPGLSAGREWDVRIVKPRVLSKIKEVKVSGLVGEAIGSTVDGRKEIANLEGGVTKDEGWEMVCRPKVGIRTLGGGFIALWRKMEKSWLDPESAAGGEAEVEA